MKNLWNNWRKIDLECESQQLYMEGRDRNTVNGEFARLLAKDINADSWGYSNDPTFQDEVNALFDRCENLPMREGYRYVEPSDLEGIRAERKQKLLFVYPGKLSKALRRDRIHGAWLGRSAGCLLGKPIEGTIRPRLLKFLKDLGLKEINDYIWRLPGLTKEMGEGLNRWHGNTPQQYLDTKTFPGDDDTNYTVMSMALVKKYGVNFTPDDVAQFWISNLPFTSTCTAERTAYRNFVNCINPPRSAVVRNPYREWIGAQIRADFYGYVALGNPEFAAELAWRDASISHTKNGIYGSMWVAAMLAGAIYETDMNRLIKIGLEQIPAKSRMYEAINHVIDLYEKGESYDEMVEYLHIRWNEENPQHWHLYANAQIIAMALLYGEGDFEKSITKAVYPCFDTDCNGATVGSIVGMMLGAKALPEKWTGVMHDKMHTDIAGYQDTKISKLAEEMFQLQDKASKER